MSVVELPAATMLSIWCRTAMAVVEFDWATDRSVQAGHRTFVSMTAARCATVWDDESNAPLPIRRATPRTRRGRRTRAHSGTTANLAVDCSGMGRTRPFAGRLEERVEVLLRGRPLEHRGHAARRVHDERRRRRRDPVTLGDRPARVAHRRPEVAVLAQER